MSGCVGSFLVFGLILGHPGAFGEESYLGTLVLDDRGGVVREFLRVV